MLGNFVLRAQEIECDGAFYLVVYTESEAKSRLYKVTGKDKSFDYQEIPLSETRRLTGLNYNLDDKFLYALDVNSLEIVRIDKSGNINSLGVPENLDTSLDYSSGTFSPQSGSMLFSGFDPTLEKDTKMYGLNIERFYAGNLGVTGAFPVKITDLATDPITGVIYGFNSLRSTLIETSISGGTTSYQYTAVQSSDIDALFFDPSGQLYGYSPSTGLYAIDKNEGTMTQLGKVVEGTHADGCSCPYTFEFNKEVSPKEIVPCEEFTVEYKFNNKMAVGQVVKEFRDTFPEGFEIVNVETDLIYTFTEILDTEKNIIAIDLFIYLVGENSIKLKVKAPENFIGEFGSRGLQSDFATAFGVVMKTDDPGTELFEDPTIARIIDATEIDFTDHIIYSCDGLVATINSPIGSDTYEWSNGSTESSITTEDEGWYSLKTSNECIYYFDSVEIRSFPGQKELDLGDEIEVEAGDSILIKLDDIFGLPMSVDWYLDNESIDCKDCSEIWVKPNTDAMLTIDLVDEQGCNFSDQLQINLIVRREVYQANAFTPNNDGFNDFFYIQTASPAQIKNMKVFDRWGNVVFDKSDFPANDEMEGWQGMTKESSINNSVFVYVADIIYTDGVEEQLSGEVLMISN